MSERQFLQETNFQNDVNLDAEGDVEDTKENKIKQKESDRNRWRNPYDEMSM